MSQQKFLRELIKEFEKHNIKPPVKVDNERKGSNESPIHQRRMHLSKHRKTPQKSSPERERRYTTPELRAYAGPQMRPGFCDFPANFLASKFANPTENNFGGIIHCLRYTIASR
jgi:hypothetical protein